MAKAEKEPTYIAVQVEAALCVWEQLMEWTNKSDAEVEELRKDMETNALVVEWNDMRSDCGSAEMRSQSIVLGLWCLEIYDLLTKSDPDFFDWWSYDWEVIPAMLTHAVCKDGKASMYRGDYIYTGGELIDPQSAAQLVAQEFIFRRFVDDCKAEAKKQWAYEDLVTDDCKTRYDYSGGRMQQAFEMDEKPADFVKWLGEKYDLTPVSEWA